MDRTGIDDFEVNTVLALTQYFADHWTIFDIGSNKGGWSDILIEERDHSNKAGQYTIHFFEPNELLLNYTRVKYEYNPHIIYNPLAVCDKNDKEIDFYYFTNYNNGLSSIHYNPFWDQEKLPFKKGKALTITLDKYASEITEIDIIKIDVEGAEIDVLKGCKELLKAKKVKCIQIEYSPHYKKSKYKFKENILEFVAQFGYSVYLFDGSYFQQVTAENFVEDYVSRNYILSHLVLTRYHYTQLWNSEFQKNTINLRKEIKFALEIGSFEGLTSNYICDFLLKEKGRLICVDPLEDKYMDHFTQEENEMFVGQYQRFIKNTRGQPIELIKLKSVDAFEQLKDYLFDFIYIDGDHTEEGVFRDGRECFRILKVGGYLLFDDYTWSKETNEGINKFLGKFQGRYIEVSKNYQVLIKKLSD